ncbi:MAG: 3-oxoacyl-[acyl-carrier-protein] reductase [Peptococcaceae bacterium]|nr:3-oxoacyl-[acyl-carrier-protein] reductase [Candidatus Syntrophopropionicum ammoniitolerans]
MILDGKIAIITGASRGIGRAIALTLAKRGATVVINYASNAEAAEETAGQVRDNGSRALVFKANVANPEEAGALVKTTLDEYGSVDILVNNAGITRDSFIVRMKDDDWDQVIGVNLKGAFNCTKAAARAMIRGRWGRIINISSVVALAGNTGQANYCAAKAGLIGLTKAMAKELGPRNITVNAVAPGFITTEMTLGLPEELKEKMLAQIPLKKFGGPNEVADLVAFLTSDAAGYISGQTIAVDGGMTCI